MRHGYTRPRFGERLRIRAGRHPVVERRTAFVPNDLEMAHELVLVTGPNMAGKSTFLRQTALIALLAQIGSFVPAEEAELPSLTGSTRGSGPRTTSPGGRAPSWWRWRRWPWCSRRPPNVASSSWTRWAGARAAWTGWPSPPPSPRPCTSGGATPSSPPTTLSSPPSPFPGSRTCTWPPRRRRGARLLPPGPPRARLQELRGGGGGDGGPAQGGGGAGPRPPQRHGREAGGRPGGGLGAPPRLRPRPPHPPRP